MQLGVLHGTSRTTARTSMQGPARPPSPPGSHQCAASPALPLALRMQSATLCDRALNTTNLWTCAALNTGIPNHPMDVCCAQYRRT
eukprot:366082-Chlamydomonas_euryale.AAC.8